MPHDSRNDKAPSRSVFISRMMFCNCNSILACCTGLSTSASCGYTRSQIQMVLHRLFIDSDMPQLLLRKLRQVVRRNSLHFPAVRTGNDRPLGTLDLHSVLGWSTWCWGLGNEPFDLIGHLVEQGNSRGSRIQCNRYRSEINHSGPPVTGRCTEHTSNNSRKQLRRTRFAAQYHPIPWPRLAYASPL